MELTTLDTDLLRVHQALSELIAMGLVEPFFYTNEEDQPTRYRLAGRPGDEDEEDEEDEEEISARFHAVGAA